MNKCVCVCAFFFFIFFSSFVHSHDVAGVIVNDSPYMYNLTNSVAKQGNFKTKPTQYLPPYGFTSFALSSYILKEQITYEFTYTSMDKWCADPDASNSLSGRYEYSFGANSCVGSSLSCSDSYALKMTYKHCSTSVGTSTPQYSITHEKILERTLRQKEDEEEEEEEEEEGFVVV